MRLLLFLLLAGILNAHATTYNSDGSNSDVSTKIGTAVDGDTIMIPAGSFSWTTGVVISGKGIKLQGAGAGRVIGRSTSSVAIGTGAKTFTTQSGLSISGGQTLRIERTGDVVIGGNASGGRASMTGTVTSYSGTSLVMNITSVVGSGTHAVWYIATPATTTITHNAGATVLFNLTEDTSHSVEISGVRIVGGTATEDVFSLGSISGGQPILLHDCYFESNSGAYDEIQVYGNKGVIWNCSFVAHPFSLSQLAIHHKPEGETASWTTAGTMGSADTTGKSNLYIEDCDFHAWLNACDEDDNARGVYRHVLFNNAGFGTHGADTSNYGVRHWEVYDSEFVFNGFNDGTTLNINQWFYLRGGTGIVTDTVIQDISSQDYGNKPELNMTVMNLQRNAGPNPCWGAGISGNQYPAPRQVGMGRLTGSAGNDSITYKGDSEPIYLWNNTGSYSIGLSDFGGSDCTSPDSTVDYIVAGRDYFNNGTAKPSYAKYTYPHPLRSGGGDTTPPTLSSATIGSSGTQMTLTFGESVTIGSGGNSGWTTSLSGGAATLTYSSGSGTSALVYTISRTIDSGETGTVAYTQPSNGIEDAAGNDLATISSGSVTNNSTQWSAGATLSVETITSDTLNIE